MHLLFPIFSFPYTYNAFICKEPRERQRQRQRQGQRHRDKDRDRERLREGECLSETEKGGQRLREREECKYMRASSCILDSSKNRWEEEEENFAQRFFLSFPFISEHRTYESKSIAHQERQPSCK